jgi:hypothetical protein
VSKANDIIERLKCVIKSSAAALATVDMEMIGRRILNESWQLKKRNASIT